MQINSSERSQVPPKINNWALSTHTFKAMGSPCEIKLWSLDAALGQKALLAAAAEIDRLEQKYTRFKDTSLTSTINRQAGSGRATSIDNETYQLLCYADEAFQQSEGLFDITSGVLRRGWDFKRKIVPSLPQVQQLLSLIGWEKVSLTAHSIELPLSGMEIDFGGYVKEYAADVAAKVCHDMGINSALVNLGGDIRVTGPQPNGSGWPIGVHHPRKKKQVLQRLQLSQGGLATSGDYERYFEFNGQRFAHILNPKTGCPVSSAASVTVYSESCLLSGTAATVAMLNGPQALGWLKELSLPFLLVDHNLECFGHLF
jgi:FAD:protein FMN transferase